MPEVTTFQICEARKPGRPDSVTRGTVPSTHELWGILGNERLGASLRRRRVEQHHRKRLGKNPRAMTKQERANSAQQSSGTTLVGSLQISLANYLARQRPMHAASFLSHSSHTFPVKGLDQYDFLEDLKKREDSKGHEDVFAL